MRGRLIHGLAAALLVFAGTPVATAETVDDVGQWLAFFGQGDLGGSSGRLKWWFDGHARFLDDANGFNQSIVRPGVGWSLTDKLAVWGGYGWINTAPLTGNSFDEHRIWQQSTWSQGNDLWTVALRSRLEQRFVETGDDVGLRFRQLVRAQRHFPCRPCLSLVAWDEIFFNLNDTDWGAQAGFDQNRVFLGVGVKLNADGPIRTEIGYLNQVIDVPTNADRVNHILSINFYY